jgi:hypothetical protein
MRDQIGPPLCWSASWWCTGSMRELCTLAPVAESAGMRRIPKRVDQSTMAGGETSYGCRRRSGTGPKRGTLGRINQSNPWASRSVRS